ncbi:hypothetical protein [Paenibacillus lignilyticus]|uniref:Uncharacterized protein n=1 Tax=Paenibacillus lignilyticus TaxID=1172615 RepID=A0ABS5CF04_9BACL|nr:hypothetical protein [Paenibacillus lignilyticus]MBP3964436.1 hypothetical protein [Paenibacillus lignilyticus]
MSRVQKFGSRKSSSAIAAKKQAEQAASEVAAGSEVPFPSRRKTHPSNKQQMAGLFYKILIFLFVLLLVGLLLWGKQFD